MKYNHWFAFCFDGLKRNIVIKMRDDANSLSIKFDLWERVKFLFNGELWIDKVETVKEVENSLPRFNTNSPFDERLRETKIYSIQ